MEFGRVSVEEAKRFREDGMLFKRGYFDAEEIALLRRAVGKDDSLQANMVEIPDPEWVKTELVVWNHPGDDLFGAVARCARIVEAMESMLGGEVYHYHSKLIAKQPRTGGGFRWHQDFGYWYENGILFPDLASVMIAVDCMTVENGCLQVLKGSHRLGRVTHIDVGGQKSADPERVAEAMKVLEHVHCELEPGDCLFTHCNTLHASAPNESDKPRTALLCCYNAARNNPFRAHHHASYTPIEMLPDEAVKERGHVLKGAERAYLTADSVETHEVRGKAAS
jgi:ectoine hydroxylase-related dioxygenase (phytanoyl-CoA dioxygenase family)